MCTFRVMSHKHKTETEDTLSLPQGPMQDTLARAIYPCLKYPRKKHTYEEPILCLSVPWREKSLHGPLGKPFSMLTRKLVL